nr:MAG TPA: Terminase large subunit [Caudoviricetes sp.]
MAYSKSFLSVLTLMIKAILYPGAKLFVTAGGKKKYL